MTFIEFVNEHLQLEHRQGSAYYCDDCDEEEYTCCEDCGLDKDVYTSKRAEDDGLLRCLDCWEKEYYSNIAPPKEEENDVDTRLALVEKNMTEVIRTEIYQMREDMKTLLEGVKSMRQEHFKLENEIATMKIQMGVDRQFVEDVQGAMVSSFPDTFAELKRKL